MKICTRCNVNKDESEYHKNQKYRCKECINLMAREWKSNNKDSKKIADAKYYQNNKDVFIESNKRFKKKNPNHAKQYRETNKKQIADRMKLYWDYNIENLTDYYVNQVYKRFKDHDLHASLVSVKREQLKIKRLIKKREL